MTPSRWRQLESLYNQALEMDATERTAFLRIACGNDLDLQRDLEELFAEEPQAASFLEKAALREIAQEFAATAPNGPFSTSSPSWVGRQIGNYQVVSLVGAGGMGEVYRARDTKLKRDVAIKILPDEFSGDPDRVTRFQREAELLASLNHPSIASIYDLEESDSHRFLILELVDGETLAERLTRGPIPLNDALQLASQIAEALASAHKRGIIHRDLKPANIKLTPEDKVKVLDFGLAKAFAGEAEVNSSRLPTKMQTSIPGTILGTAAYMSPEQASGAVLDGRTDIFAFGAVLYEMLTGAPAFPGGTTTEILGAVFKEEPDWSRLPAGTSPVVIHLLRRCLQKDRNRRLHDIADARVEIEDALRLPPEMARPVAVAEQKRRPRRVLLGASAALVVVLAAVLLWEIRPTSLPVYRGSVSVAEHPVLNSGYPGLSLALSPVDNVLVYVGGNPKQLYLRRLNETPLNALPGTKDAAQPFFSPNGEWVGFFTRSEIKKVAIAGGSAVTVFDNGEEFGYGAFGAWVDDDTIVFGGVPGGGENAALRRIRSDGNGLPEVLTSLNQELGERMHSTPQWIPGTRAVLFGVKYQGFSTRVEAVMVDTGKRQIVLENATQPRYLNNRHLIFMREDVLQVAPFNPEKLKVEGDAVPVREDIDGDLGAVPQLVVSASGTLAFMPQEAEGTQIMGSVSKNGTFTPFPGVSATTRKLHPRVSHDEQNIAFQTKEGLLSKVHVYNVPSGTTSPLTTEGSDELGAWHPNGRQIALFSIRKNSRSMVLRDLSGGPDRLLVNASSGTFLRPANWSPDNVLVYVVQGAPGAQIWTVSDDGKPPVPIAFGISPVFSPDGRWLAYVSASNVVNVIPYPVRDAIPIVIGKGRGPVWGTEGKELFYREDSFTGGFIRVSITPKGQGLGIGSEEKLFPARVAVGTNGVVEQYAGSNVVGPGYDFLRKSQKFVALRRPVESTAEISIVYNWFQEFR